MIELFTVCDEESAACAQRLVQQLIEADTPRQALKATFNVEWRGPLRFAPRPRALVRSSSPKAVAATRRSDAA
jgi:hypothetical protein